MVIVFLIIALYARGGVFVMNFEDLYKNIDVPIVIYKNDFSEEIIYENRSAIYLLNSIHEDGELDINYCKLNIEDLIKMDKSRLNEFKTLLNKNDEIVEFATFLYLETGKEYPVSISANKFEYNRKKYIKLSIQHLGEGVTQPSTDAVVNMFKMAYTSKSTYTTIQNILEFAGVHMDVSKVYIVETMSETSLTNTYGWYAEGVENNLKKYQKVSKAKFNFNKASRNGMIAIENVRTTKKENEFIKDSRIKSDIAVAMTYEDEIIGHIVLEDYDKYRKWKRKETEFIKDLSAVLSSLILRREVELKLENSLKVLKTVTDNPDSSMLVRDLESRKILFTNNLVQKSVNKTEEELKEMKCEDILRGFGHDMCDRCPVNKMVDKNGNVVNKKREWEFQNPNTKKWYLVRDDIIDWIDGRGVHLQVATEITKRKDYETKLRHVASIDSMTGVYNREWGRRLLETILNKDDEKQDSLVFIDLDNLKKTNDEFGHVAGDQLILKTVELIKSCTRKSDTLCRWGGDEFILIIRANESQAEIVMEKIHKLAEEYRDSQEKIIDWGFSYGVVEIDSSIYKNVDDLISKADEKMYINKKNAR